LREKESGAVHSGEGRVNPTIGSVPAEPPPFEVKHGPGLSSLERSGCAAPGYCSPD
jgi:hypothetical protein